MKTKELIFKAYYAGHDDTYLQFFFLNDDAEQFTKKFLTEYYEGQNKGIGEASFKVKYNSKSRAYENKTLKNQIPIFDLERKVVELKVLLKHYSFTSNEKKIMGWHLTLIHMYCLE